ncbi:N-acetylmuramoyl-L-alanine amidase family protein [Aestuariibius sp. 2305UL40-4]|uniref:N-acetylmuramoyl-L-alanine amidase family protein n=1 Tax=Aestuariibius violaceus TaxID=3234132 RepID=UPI00345E8CDB
MRAFLIPFLILLAGAVTAADKRPVIAIDPGHGGRDPGAVTGDLHEADLMLLLARQVAEEIAAQGQVRAVLIREDDSFLGLQARISRARAAGAGALLSLHADALEEGGARGASLYTLSDEALAPASRLMPMRHGPDDLILGVDLSGKDDGVAIALMDLVRQDTAPRSAALARAITAAMETEGVPMNRRPLRHGSLAVLRAADMPSVLIEAGFLSDPEDRARLQTAEGRAAVARAIASGVARWVEEDASFREGMRR